nr:fimbrillin family protein [Bacteroides intestinalis]
MKTKQLMNLALIFGLLLTAGCGDDQNTGTAENNDPVELRISPRVTLTRGVVDGTAFGSGATVAVYAEGTDYTADKSNNYAKYKYSSSAWNSDGSDKIYLTNAEATIYAYYPTDDKHNITNLTIPVTLLEGTEATTITAVNNVTGTSIAAATGEVDCMYAMPVLKVTNKSNQTKGVELTMKHALSMVSFRVYKAADYEGTGKLTKIVLKNVDTGTTLSKGASPTMNIKTGAITEGTPTAATYTRTIKDGYTLEDTAAGAGAKKFSIMVLPISTIGNDKIQATFTIDGAEYTVKLTAPSDNSGAWLAGKNHLYTVKLSGTELSISTITVTQWVGVVGGTLEIK